jgi:hypothetical protein
MTNRLIKWFAFAHLPAKLQEISAPCAQLATQMDEILPEGPEKTAGLRKLLEAKDCFVRAEIEGREQAPKT